MNPFQLGFVVRLAAVVIASVTCASAAEPASDWKAGMAQAKITPEQPVLMAGYAARTKPSGLTSSGLRHIATTYLAICLQRMSWRKGATKPAACTPAA
ncbi:MAG TPA: hypothetical protein VGM05_31170 [Planctomycetaceae bacterium]